MAGFGAGELWYPANPIERAMGWALYQLDFARFFEAFTVADLFVPVGAEGGDGVDAFGGREFVTGQIRDRTYLPVYTSDEGMMASLGDAWEMLVLAEFGPLRDSWPRPEWLLGINPGLPIEAFLPWAAFDRCLRGEVEPVVDPEVLIHGIGDNHWRPWRGSPNEALLAAVADHYALEYFDVLPHCLVTSPTTRELTSREVARMIMTRTELPWRVAGTADTPVVEVFTSKEACVRAYPDPPWLTGVLGALLDLWPAGHGLAVNPGGPAGMDVPASKMPTFQRLVGMGAVGRQREPSLDSLMDGMRWAFEAGPPEDLWTVNRP